MNTLGIDPAHYRQKISLYLSMGLTQELLDFLRKILLHMVPYSIDAVCSFPHPLFISSFISHVDTISPINIITNTYNFVLFFGEEYIRNLYFLEDIFVHLTGCIVDRMI